MECCAASPVFPCQEGCIDRKKCVISHITASYGGFLNRGTPRFDKHL